MRVRFISSGKLCEYKKAVEEKPCEGEGADILVFPFGGVDEVSYAKELKGETCVFETVAELSKCLRAAVVCGCVTNTGGHKRKSAIVANKGKLLGVTDMLNAVDGEVASGASLQVYATDVGKMGVAVADDLQVYEVMRALTLCGSDFLVCVCEKPKAVHGALIRAWAYCLGVPVLLAEEGRAGAADETGALAFSSTQAASAISVTPRREYHLVETRRRGKR